MPVNFWDTSALAKLYVPERGSHWATMTADDGVAISELAIVELAHVFGRQCREGRMDTSERDDLYQRFLRDAAAFERLEVTEAVVRSAASLLLEATASGRVRSLDAIQLASARHWFERATANRIDPGAFIVADGALSAAAAALGMAVDNPEEHE